MAAVRTSGVVAVHTVDPQLDSFNGFGTVELGDYELRHYTAAVNVPIGDTLAVRVSGNSYNREATTAPTAEQSATRRVA